MSLRNAIKRLRSGTYIVTRKAQGTDDGHGRYVDDGEATELEMVGSVQPITGAALGDGSEGQVKNERVRVFTKLKLIVRSDDNQPDTFVYNGGVYQVDTVLTHTSFGDTHYIVEATYTGAP